MLRPSLSMAQPAVVAGPAALIGSFDPAARLRPAAPQFSGPSGAWGGLGGAGQLTATPPPLLDNSAFNRSAGAFCGCRGSGWITVRPAAEPQGAPAYVDGSSPPFPPPASPAGTKRKQIAVLINAYNRPPGRDQSEHARSSPASRDSSGVWNLRRHSGGRPVEMPSINRARHPAQGLQRTAHPWPPSSCAAVSCPPLRRGAPFSANIWLDAQLTTKVDLWLSPDPRPADRSRTNTVASAKIYRVVRRNSGQHLQNMDRHRPCFNGAC